MHILSTSCLSGPFSDASNQPCKYRDGQAIWVDRDNASLSRLRLVVYAFPFDASIIDQTFPSPGTHLALFCVTFRHIYRFLRPRTKLIWTILAYIILLFVLATVGVALQIRWSTLAFADRSSTTPEFLVAQVNNQLSLAKTAMFVLTF
jgi:membrane-associated HD superfamily phosphohydrolase